MRSKQNLREFPGVFSFHRSFFATACFPLLFVGCGAASSPQTASLPPAAGLIHESAPSLVDISTGEKNLSAEPATAEMGVAATRWSIQTDRRRRAQQLFNRLTDPQIPSADWDAVHLELIELGSDGAVVLGERLQQGVSLEREMAAMTLALIGADAHPATESLIAALRDESPFVRANAAAALVQIPERAVVAVPTLVELLESSDGGLRQLAATNLGVIGAEAAPFAERLAQSIAADRDPEVVIPVVQLLGRIGPSAQSALPGLRQIAFETDGATGEAVRETIQRIDGSIGAAAAP